MRVELDDLVLEVEDHGSGVPFVLLHGFPLSAEIWSPVRPAVEQVARVITPDLRGFGRSGRPRSGYDLDTLARDVVGVADRLGVTRFVLGGHSMGGYAALALAAGWPERVAGLVLIDTRATAETPEGSARRDAAIAELKAGRAAGWLDGFVGNLVGPSTRLRAPRLVAELRAIAAEASVDALIGCLAAMRDRPDRSALLGKLDLPALVVVGEEDALTPSAEAHALAAAIGGARLAVIPGSGHTPSVERPIATADALVAFLRALPAA